MTNKIATFVNNEDNNNELAALVAQTEVTGKIYNTDSVQAIYAEYKAKNIQTVGNIKVKAADIFLSEVHIIDDKNFFQLENEVSEGYLVSADESKNDLQVLVSADESNIITVDSSLAANSGSIIDEFLLDSPSYNELKEASRIDSVYSEGSILHTFGAPSYNVKDGKIIVSTFTHNAFSYNNQVVDIDKVKKQIALDKSLTREQAEKISNELYDTYPIFKEVPINSIDGKILLSLKDAVLSRSYSEKPQIAEQLIAKTIEEVQAQENIILKDAFATIGLGIAKGDSYPVSPVISHIGAFHEATLAVERSEPLRIIHLDSRSDGSNTLKETSAGEYKIEFNVLSFLENEYSFAHETAHTACQLLYHNLALPYYKGEESKFEVAKKKFLVNVSKKLGQNIDEVDNKSIADVLKEINSDSILDILVMSRTPFFIDVHSFYDQFSLWDALSLVENWQKKYFPDRDISTITQNEVISKANELAENLGLIEEELQVISSVGGIIFKYPEDRFDAEIVAYTANLLYEYGSFETVKELFVPINQYWSENTHTLVEEELVIPHQLECVDANPGPVFVHCIEEFMS